VVSLVFPTYNPGISLERTLAQVERFVRQLVEPWEILFVCDGCTDGTPETLARWARPFGDTVRVMTYSPNRGKGYAVRQGFAQARGQFRIFTDVDLAYGFDDILRLAAKLKSGADVVIASRLHRESRVVLPQQLLGYAFRRYLQSLVFAGLVRFLLPVSQRDTQAGLKGMSARAALTILPYLRSKGFELDCELLTACSRFGFSVAEIPVQARYEDATSTTSAHSIAHMIRQLWRIRADWEPARVASFSREARDSSQNRVRRQAA
jgi:glycosyltransferase involved in cell wall biosynthesis